MKQSEIFAAYVEQTKFLQQMCDRLAGTLDKIVGAQYDRPVMQHAVPPSDPPPQGLLFDQSDVRPADPIERGINALNMESDTDWQKAVQ